MTSVAATQFLPLATAAAVTGRSMIVSLHDVAPVTWDATKEVLAELQRRGVRSCSLLVVPNYHHAGASMQNKPFAMWLRELQADGHETVIHGYFHERPRRSGESWANRFLTRVYTQDEGEFFDLPYDEARRRVDLAREEFELAGLKARGFVAPAWLLGSEAERAARDAGMEYTIRIGSVHDLRSGDTFRACSLVYSSRNQWRRSASLCWNAMLAQIAHRDELMRVSIHPADYQHPRIWKQICQVVERMRSERTPTTYHDWTAEWRIRRASGL